MDSNTIIRLATLCFTILSSAFAIIMFCVIKFNDLAHLDSNMQKLSNKHDELQKEVSGISKMVSSIDGYIKGQNSIK